MVTTLSFCQAEVRRAVDDDVVAEGWLVYKISLPKPAGETAE